MWPLSRPFVASLWGYRKFLPDTLGLLLAISLNAINQILVWSSIHVLRTLIKGPEILVKVHMLHLLTKSHILSVATKIGMTQTLKGAGNSIISGSWSNYSYSPILSYWLIVCGYEMSANRRAVSQFPVCNYYKLYYWLGSFVWINILI